MDYKVSENKWQELMYFINNFYTPIQYTNGRGVYPDRVTLARGRSVENCLGFGGDLEFAILNARAEESNLASLKLREIIERVVRDSVFMNNLLNEGNKDRHDYQPLFVKVGYKLEESKTTDYKKLNDFLLKAYYRLEPKDALKIASFREEAIDKCVEQNLISAEFGEKQKSLFPNSLVKLSTNFDVNLGK